MIKMYIKYELYCLFQLIVFIFNYIIIYLMTLFNNLNKKKKFKLSFSNLIIFKTIKWVENK